MVKDFAPGISPELLTVLAETDHGDEHKTSITR
jgi:L-fucose mutarotase/ribose pyranase (RbsD/FucU family)